MSRILDVIAYGVLGAADARAPQMQGNRPHVDDIEERVQVIDDDVADVTIRLFRKNFLRAHLARNELRRVFLKKGFSCDSIGVASQHKRPIF